MATIFQAGRVWLPAWNGLQPELLAPSNNFFAALTETVSTSDSYTETLTNIDPWSSDFSIDFGPVGGAFTASLTETAATSDNFTAAMAAAATLGALGGAFMASLADTTVTSG